MTEAKVTAPILIGHSLGGYLALAFIEKYPEYASGIALVNSTTLADSSERKIQRTRTINLVKEHPGAFIQMAIKNLFPEAGQKEYQNAVKQLISDAKNLPIEAIQASLKAMRDREDRSEVLRKFDKKKLFIYGNQDPLISIEASKEAINKSQCPNIALNAGHMAWLEDQVGLHKALLEFVNQT